MSRAQFVGLDTLSHIARGWREERVSTGEIDAKQVEEVPTLEKLVQSGKLGRKSGKGLFDCECHPLAIGVDSGSTCGGLTNRWMSVFSRPHRLFVSSSLADAL